MKVFVGGSRHVSRLNTQVLERLDKIIQKRLPVLIGDANGADKAVQRYLHSKRYPSVQVFCAGNCCRNNIGNWNLRTVPAEARTKTFDFYAAKDREMAREANIGLMIWDGKSVGTLLNILRLITQRKKVVVYNAMEQKFWELRNHSDWQVFVSKCGADQRNRLEKKMGDEQMLEQLAQPSLLT